MGLHGLLQGWLYFYSFGERISYSIEISEINKPEVRQQIVCARHLDVTVCNLVSVARPVDYKSLQQNIYCQLGELLKLRKEFSQVELTGQDAFCCCVSPESINAKVYVLTAQLSLTTGPASGAKRPGREAWLYTPNAPRVFMAWFTISYAQHNLIHEFRQLSERSAGL
jgi:hypothetical protein